MTQHQKADQARKGLVDSVKGKAKEIAGAVTGNDSLTAEGQLEQVQAKHRKDANAVEALADAEAEQARQEATEATAEAAAERRQVQAEAAVVETAARTEAAAKKQAVEQSAQRDVAVAQTQADLDAQREAALAKSEERADLNDAAEEVIDAVEEHSDRTLDADTDRAAAKSLRQQAAKVSDQADLP